MLRFATQGALGDDYGAVLVRPTWWPFAESVYNGLGAWDFEHEKPSDPEVRWLDDAHLLIRFADDRKLNDGRGGTGPI